MEDVDDKKENVEDESVKREAGTGTESSDEGYKEETEEAQSSGGKEPAAKPITEKTDAAVEAFHKRIEEMMKEMEEEAK